MRQRTLLLPHVSNSCLTAMVMWVQKEEEAKKKQAAEAASKPKKAGAWGGLPR